MASTTTGELPAFEGPARRERGLRMGRVVRRRRIGIGSGTCSRIVTGTGIRTGRLLRYSRVWVSQHMAHSQACSTEWLLDGESPARCVRRNLKRLPSRTFPKEAVHSGFAQFGNIVIPSTKRVLAESRIRGPARMVQLIVSIECIYMHDYGCVNVSIFAAKKRETT
jgi:hypothetical protein